MTTVPSNLAGRVGGWFAARQIILSLLMLFGWIEETAWRLPGDASYDLLNYHLYGPFALLHGKWTRDLAAAQSQGFLPPTNDIPYYLLARHIGDVRRLNLLLALPAAAAVCLAFLITIRLLAARRVTERLVALVAVLIAATGAATHPVLATSMSDMIPCSLMLGAMLLLLREADAASSHRPSPGLPRFPGHLLAGLLSGMALGLKLTFSYAALALAVALLFRADVKPLLRVRIVFVFCLAVGIGTLAVGGWWWLHLWRVSGNPMFPYYNNLFRSPLAWPGDFIDRRFFPRDLAHAVFYPFFWAVQGTPLVTEPDEPMRDPRIAFALLSAVVVLARSISGPASMRGTDRFASVFFIVAFVLWERQFSIFRYLSPLELLSATLPAMLALSLARDERACRAILAIGLVLLVALRFYTIYPNWGRLHELGGPPLAVQVKTLPPDSLVLMLDAAPLAYLAVFEPDSVRFMGTNNNLTQPQQGGLMQQRIRAAIAAQPRHLYGLEKPDFDSGSADRTLAAYGLRRADCDDVVGDIVGSRTRLCALVK